MPPCLSRALVLAAGLATTACQPGPGPAEQAYLAVQALCSGGNEQACREAHWRYPQAVAERAGDTAQREAFTAGLVGAMAGAALGAAIARPAPTYIVTRPGWRRW